MEELLGSSSNDDGTTSTTTTMEDVMACRQEIYHRKELVKKVLEEPYNP